MFQDNLTKIRGPLHEDRHTFLIISEYIYIYIFIILLEREMFRTNVAEEIKTHILCSVIVFSQKIMPFIMRKNMVQPYRPQMA